MELIIGIIALVLVVGVPSFLLMLLVYFGEKSARADSGEKSVRPGFEVIPLTGPSPVTEIERDQNHG